MIFQLFRLLFCRQNETAFVFVAHFDTNGCSFGKLFDSGFARIEVIQSTLARENLSFFRHTESLRE